MIPGLGVTFDACTGDTVKVSDTQVTPDYRGNLSVTHLDRIACAGVECGPQPRGHQHAVDEAGGGGSRGCSLNSAPCGNSGQRDPLPQQPYPMPQYPPLPQPYPMTPTLASNLPCQLQRSRFSVGLKADDRHTLRARTCGSTTNERQGRGGRSHCGGPFVTALLAALKARRTWPRGTPALAAAP